MRVCILLFVVLIGAVAEGAAEVSDLAEPVAAEGLEVWWDRAAAVALEQRPDQETDQPYWERAGGLVREARWPEDRARIERLMGEVDARWPGMPPFYRWYELSRTQLAGGDTSAAALSLLHHGGVKYREILPELVERVAATGDRDAATTLLTSAEVVQSDWFWLLVSVAAGMETPVASAVEMARLRDEPGALRPLAVVAAERGDVEEVQRILALATPEEKAEIALYIVSRLTGGPERHAAVAEALLPLLSGEARQKERWDVARAWVVEGDAARGLRLVEQAEAHEWHVQLGGFFPVLMMPHLEAQPEVLLAAAETEAMAREGNPLRAEAAMRLAEAGRPLEAWYVAFKHFGSMSEPPPRHLDTWGTEARALAVVGLHDRAREALANTRLAEKRLLELVRAQLRLGLPEEAERTLPLIGKAETYGWEPAYQAARELLEVSREAEGPEAAARWQRVAERVEQHFERPEKDAGGEAYVWFQLVAEIAIVRADGDPHEMLAQVRALDPRALPVAAAQWSVRADVPAVEVLGPLLDTAPARWAAAYAMVQRLVEAREGA